MRTAKIEKIWMVHVFKLFLLASGVLFWIAVGVAAWLQTRSFRSLAKHKEEWPEPVFRKMSAQSVSQVDVLFATLRRDATRLSETVGACQRGAGLVAIEDFVIRDEINKALETNDLMVVVKD